MVDSWRVIDFEVKTGMEASPTERRRFARQRAATDATASAAPREPAAADVARVVAAALLEDVGAGDLTTEALVDAAATISAVVVLEEPGVVCGLGIATAVFAALDPGVRVVRLVEEGASSPRAPAEIARVEGSARAVLTGERTALNLLARLSGIATLTARFVERVAGTGATILDTRKTTPGLRALERYAVRCGGGVNHRDGLFDAILVKENHLRIAGGIGPALAALAGRDEVEVEAETLEEVAQALAAGAPRILLDNMTPEEVARAVALVGGRARLEASGGMTLDGVRAYAETGVDFVSVGALTRSARALQLSLELV